MNTINKQLNLQIPEELKSHFVFNKVIFIVFGFIFLGIGTFLGITATKDYPFSELIYLHSNKTVGEATIVGYQEGKVYKDNGSSRHYILKYEYFFETKTGESFLWHSYSYRTDIKVGQKLKVTYNAKHPQYSVLDGFQSHSLNNGMLITSGTLLFLGIALFSTPFSSASKKMNILKTGYTTNARFVKSIENRSSEDNSLISYEVIFNYVDNKDRVRRIYRTIKPRELKKYTDEETEWIIYDKNDSYTVVFIDELPKKMASKIKIEISKHIS